MGSVWDIDLVNLVLGVKQMGEAKRRGTFEERKRLAKLRNKHVPEVLAKGKSRFMAMLSGICTTSAGIIGVFSGNVRTISTRLLTGVGWFSPKTENRSNHKLKRQIGHG